MNEYVITDPCYILEGNKWDECINTTEAKYGKDYTEEQFIEVVNEVLKEFTGSQEVWSCDTGFGDWDNTLEGPHVGDADFTADSGTVCVCKYTNEVANALKDKTRNGNAAVFKATGPITVNFNRDRSDWTIVEIEEADGLCWNTFIPWDEDDE